MGSKLRGYPYTAKVWVQAMDRPQCHKQILALQNYAMLK